MAELMFPDLAGRFQQGQQLGLAQRLQGQGEQRRNRLAELAGQAYGSTGGQRDSFVQQAVATDPEAGFALGKSLQSDEDQRKKIVAENARLLVGVPEAFRAQAYKQMLPQLRSLNIGEFPDEYDPSFYDVAQSINQAYGGSDGGPYANLPSDIRSLRLLQDNPELAALDKERRQYSGMVPKMVETSQGIGWGTPGGGIQLAPLEGVAGQGQPQGGGDAGQLFAALGQKYGIQPTSVRRTPERNRAVGGVENSFHLSGQAADWVVPQQHKAQFMRDAQSNGFQAIDEGDHIHIEPARRGGSSSVAQPYQAPQREQTPSGYRPSANGGLEAIPGGPADPNVARPIPPAQRLKMEQNQRKERQMLTTMGAGIDQTIKLIDDVLANGDSLGGVTGIGSMGARIPGTKWADVAAKLDTLKARSAFGSLQEMRANSPTGGALGAVSERELYLLQNAETQLQNSQSPESLKAALRDYKATLQASKRRMAEGLDEAYTELNSAAPQDGPSQRQSSEIDSLLDLYR